MDLPLGPYLNYNTTEHYDGTNWTSSGSMSTPRCYMAGFGIQTSAVAAAGATLNPDVGRNQTEEYNGSSWTSATNMPTYQRNHFGVGTLTAGVTTGGKSGPSSTYSGITNTNTTFEYDGTNWTAGRHPLLQVDLFQEVEHKQQLFLLVILKLEAVKLFFL